MTSQPPESAENPGASRPPGTVYTFYSYKGGVGRSMAVVNVGVLLALQGKRVLLVDWDLEAPGLEVYFEKSPNAKLMGDPAIVPGIVDLLESRAADRELPWKTCLLKAEFLGQSLDIISAGSRTADYRARLQKLDWETLYSKHHIGNFVDGLREEWRAPDNYDFILVDSRTGVTDIGDICTVLLPDAIVLMFVTNYQNIDGIKNVMERAEKARKTLPVNRAKLHGVPLPARDEVYNEYDKSLEWKKRFGQEFAELYREWLPREVSPDDALAKLFIPYVTNWSFGERIPVLENAHETQNPSSIGAAYQRVANLLASGLDWYSLTGRVSVAELQGTQVAVLHERERAKELEQVVVAQSAKLESFETRSKWANWALWTAVMSIAFAALGAVFIFNKSSNSVTPTQVVQGHLTGLPSTYQVTSQDLFVNKSTTDTAGLTDWRFFTILGKDIPKSVNLYINSLTPGGNDTLRLYNLQVSERADSLDLKLDPSTQCLVPVPSIAPNPSLGKSYCGEVVKRPPRSNSPDVSPNPSPPR